MTPPNRDNGPIGKSQYTRKILELTHNITVHIEKSACCHAPFNKVLSLVGILLMQLSVDVVELPSGYAVLQIFLSWAERQHLDPCNWSVKVKVHIYITDVVLKFPRVGYGILLRRLVLYASFSIAWCLNPTLLLTAPSLFTSSLFNERSLQWEKTH